MSKLCQIYQVKQNVSNLCQNCVKIELRKLLTCIMYVKCVSNLTCIFFQISFAWICMSNMCQIWLVFFQDCFNEHVCQMCIKYDLYLFRNVFMNMFVKCVLNLTCIFFFRIVFMNMGQMCIKYYLYFYQVCFHEHLSQIWFFFFLTHCTSCTVYWELIRLGMEFYKSVHIILTIFYWKNAFKS